MTERLLIRTDDQPLTSFRGALSMAKAWLKYLYYRYVYERPGVIYRAKLRNLISDQTFGMHCSQLIEDGVVILPSYFSGEQLKTMQQDFDRWCETKTPEPKGITHIDGGTGEIYLSTSIALSQAIIDPYILAIVSYYWGKPIKLAYARGYRTEPISPEEYRAFQWHHDLKRKQVKVMLYLTDVPADGQRMDYIPKSHVVWHSFRSQKQSVFSREQAASYGTPIPCCGPAGTVVIFDTNGLHRGNRNLGPRRDQYTVNYTGGRALFPLPGIHPNVSGSLSGHMQRICRCENLKPSILISKKMHSISTWLADRYFLTQW